MKLALVVVAALAACKGGAKQPASGSAAVTDAAAVAVTAADAAGAAVADAAAVTLTIVDGAPLDAVIPAHSTQLVVAVIDDWDSTTATLRKYRRTGGAWVADGEPWSGVIGQGAAWGSGLHGSGPPTGRSGSTKQEGDGRSPAGAFSLLTTYGYAASGPGTPTNLPYTRATASLECVDDPESAHYNTILEATKSKDWKSSEDMRRSDEVYEYVVEVGHNTLHAPRAGSCIFLHVWRTADSPTVGCTAMPAPTLRSLMTWLERDAYPTFVLLPRAEYAALSSTWRLP